jgi:hypothetical protein
MRNVSDKSLAETQNTHFTPNNVLENRDVYKTTRKKNIYFCLHMNQNNQSLRYYCQFYSEYFPFSHSSISLQLITTELERKLHTYVPVPFVSPDNTFVFVITIIINIINYKQLRFTSCSYNSLDNRIHQFFSSPFFRVAEVYNKCREYFIPLLFKIIRCN